jgi:hypothetical protein
MMGSDLQLGRYNTAPAGDVALMNRCKQDVLEWLIGQSEELSAAGFDALVKRWVKYINEWCHDVAHM